MTRLPFPRCRRAVAALEFALTAPILLIVLGGTVDFGIANYTRTALANAVSVGAEYALLTGSGVVGNNVKTLVQSSSFVSGVTATVTGPACYCVTGSAPTMSTATCNSACSDGSTAGSYIIISATYTYSGLLSSYSYPSGFTLTESATVRLP